MQGMHLDKTRGGQARDVCVKQAGFSTCSRLRHWYASARDASNLRRMIIMRQQ
jgi:hypothetical protein